jgi:hypothetical protein
VSNQIERLRYYDGEYLRGSDFSDEQAYHVEMRRRLNHRLHLHGIVYGLQLQPDSDSPPPPAVPFFSVMPGMALDQSGREIFVPAPYSLSAENVLNRAGLTTGPNELWLCYLETQTGLPAAGYRDCNAKGQYTRWQELFQVILKPVHPTNTSVVPADCGGVRLGIVALDNSSVHGWQIIDVKNVGRSHVGIRAQRVIAADEEAETFDMAKQNTLPPKRTAPPGYVDVQPSVLERGNLIVEKNVVIGDDFLLDPTKLKPTATDLKAGNLKITSDLFLNGNFYGNSGGVWLGMEDYIKGLMPLIVVGNKPLTLTIPQTKPPGVLVNGTEPIPVQTDAAHVKNLPQVLLSISQMTWQDPKTLQANWAGNINKVPIIVTFTLPAPPLPISFNLGINWTLGPTAVDGAGTVLVPITDLVVNYCLIFTP